MVKFTYKNLSLIDLRANVTHISEEEVVNGSCQSGSVQLGGGNSSEGIVELCIGEEWGALCAEGWDQEDANVVCRQLGYNVGG